MSTIGNFTKQEDGFNGTLRTLAFNVKVKIVPITKDNDKGPDYRVLAGAMEIGAAWKRQSKANKQYLSVKLDDPSFAGTRQCPPRRWRGRQRDPILDAPQRRVALRFQRPAEPAGRFHVGDGAIGVGVLPPNTPSRNSGRPPLLASGSAGFCFHTSTMSRFCVSCRWVGAHRISDAVP